MSMLALPGHLSSLQPLASLSMCTVLGAGLVGGEVATGFSSSASQHLGLLETTETLGLTLHLGSKLLVIFPPTWNPPDPVSRVLAYATLASLSRSVFLWLGAH